MKVVFKLIIAVWVALLSGISVALAQSICSIDPCVDGPKMHTHRRNEDTAIFVEPVRARKPSFKGVELYSWKDSVGNWRYSLLPGTNRLKKRNEIVSESTLIKDIGTLKERLAGLAIGERVFWFNADPPGFEHPDSPVVADIVAYAKLVQVSVQVRP